MPQNSGNIPLVQWPLFLLASKVVFIIDNHSICRQIIVAPMVFLCHVYLILSVVYLRYFLPKILLLKVGILKMSCGIGSRGMIT